MELFKDLLIRFALPIAVALVVWLPIAISAWWEGRKFANRWEGRKFAKKDGLNYELRQPKFVLGIGIVGAVFFVAPLIIVPVTGGNETLTPAVAMGFIAFSFLGTFLAIYAIQWRIIVQNNHLIVRMPFKSVLEMKIEEITTVKEKHNGIIAYVDKKRVFDVDRHIFGFELLYAQFFEAGKMESTH